MKNNNLVYHYTSLNTFFKIITNKSFWLTDLWTTMDENEIKYAWNLIQEVTKFDLSENTHLAIAEKYYALSCTDFDDEYLHFNSYGDRCKGVCIGINTQFLITGDTELDSGLAKHLTFQKVIYDKEEQRHLIEKSMNIENRWGLPNETVPYEMYLTRMKQRQFVSEQEIRLVYAQDVGGQKIIEVNKPCNLDKFMQIIGLEKSKQDIGENRLLNCKTQEIGGRERNYYELLLEKFGIDNVIKCVIIGPCADISQQEIKKFLIQNDCHAQVFASKIKLRK